MVAVLLKYDHMRRNHFHILVIRGGTIFIFWSLKRISLSYHGQLNGKLNIFENRAVNSHTIITRVGQLTDHYINITFPSSYVIYFLPRFFCKSSTTQFPHSRCFRYIIPVVPGVLCVHNHISSSTSQNFFPHPSE